LPRTWPTWTIRFISIENGCVGATPLAFCGYARQAGRTFFCRELVMLGLPESTLNAAIISTSIVAAAAVLGAAQAATDTIFRYSSPKTGYYAVDNTDLSPDGSNSLAYLNEWDVAIQPDAGKSGCFNAGLHLPHGAVITQVRVFYRATASSGTSVATIQRKKYTREVNDEMRLEFPDSATRTAANMPLNASLTTINNLGFSYGLGVCLRNDTDAFYAARITYTYTHAGD
jgi:hypothetical protein